MTSTVSNLSTNEGTFRQYWLLIQSVASKVRTKEELFAAASSSVLAGGGAVVGTLLLPGVGSLIGGGVGIVLGAINSVIAAKKRCQRRYSRVLILSASQGLKYTIQLYELFDGFLREDQLRQYLATVEEEW